MGELQKIPHNSPLEETGKLPPEIVEIVEIVDKLFEQIFGANPNLRHRFPNEQALIATKRQWVLGFAENRVNTVEQLREGMKMFRSNCQWLPSLSEFIGWCKGNNYHHYGLPTPDEVPKRLALFRCHGRQMKFLSNAEYWLLSGLRRKEREGLWTTAQLEKAIQSDLSAMLEKCKQGMKYSSPAVKELTAKSEVHNPEKALQHIAQIKARLGVR